VTVHVAPREVRVCYRTTHADAITEACRLLTVMADLWPNEPWRYHIQRDTDPNRNRNIWGVYAIPPKGTWL
jgi:hypothetical protein